MPPASSGVLFRSNIGRDPRHLCTPHAKLQQACGIGPVWQWERCRTPLRKMHSGKSRSLKGFNSKSMLG
jgi:hypothetical protein